MTRLKALPHEQKLQRFREMFGEQHILTDELLCVSKDLTMGLLKPDRFDNRRFSRLGVFHFRRRVLNTQWWKVLPITSRWAVRLMQLWKITRYFGTGRLNIGLYQWDKGNTDMVLCVKQDGVIFLHSLVSDWDRQEATVEVFLTEASRKKWEKVRLLTVL